MGSRLRWMVLAVTGLLTAAQAGAQSEEAFQEFMKERRAEFQQFRSERDRQFHSYLKRQWEEFRAFAGEVEDPAPKPSKIPEAEPEPDKPPEPVAVRTKEPERTEPAPEEPAPREEPPAVPAPEPEPEPKALTPEKKRIRLSALGHELTVAVPAAWGKMRLERRSPQGVAKFWKAFAQGPSASPVLKSLADASERWSLGDWGYLRLVHDLGRKAASGDAESRLLAWALLLESGYAVRAGLANGEVAVLFRSRNHLFETPYFRIDGERYYVYDPDGDPVTSGLRSYKGDFPGKVRAAVVASRRPPDAAPEEEARELTFKYQGERHRVRVPVNPNLLSYQDSLPQLSLANYFLMEPPAEFSEGLRRQLKAELQGLPPREKVELLLAFVQKAFQYKRDQDQFGGENYLLPTETAHYSHSDCEDRAVLFSWLVHDLLGYPVVALDYPGHVATAVALPEGGQGRYVEWKGKRFYVADPTYVNAGLGTAMPRYADAQPEILPAW
ncbi:hypothetical protein [Thiohalorhabdus methylotrophus]|uniref:Transglutaminase-like domain-containing protein n=1 Tax=Thiohalorhabdus methylotrophus TaxID=3242694 RepID=A0ABV4TUY9_9GAMM